MQSNISMKPLLCGLKLFKANVDNVTAADALDHCVTIPSTTTYDQFLLTR